MKILRIVYEWPPPWEGLVAHPYELTRAQIKLGHMFYLFTGRWSRTGPLEKLDGATNLNFLGNPNLPFRAPVQGTLLVTIGPILLLRYIFWRFRNPEAVDLIHSHGHFALWIYWYRAFLKKHFPHSKELKTPLIVHFHNTVQGRMEKLKKANQSFSTISQYFDWPLAKKADMLAVEHADALIFVSNDLLEEAVIYYNADRSKCFVVETGVNPELFTPVGYEEKTKIHKELGIDATDKIILNIGIHTERKNTHLLVETVKLLPEHFKLLIVGPFPDSAYEERIDKYIKENHLEKRVLKGGVYDYPEIPILYQGADVFVLPSAFEGMPKVVMESLSCALPVIASGFKLSEEISGIIYLDNLDTALIAQKITEVVSNPPYVDRGKLSFIYSWDNRAHQVEQVYKKVLESRAKTL